MTTPNIAILKYLNDANPNHRQLSQQHYLTTTARIQIVFVFLFKFCIPSGVKITIALISMTKAKLEVFCDLYSNVVWLLRMALAVKNGNDHL